MTSSDSEYLEWKHWSADQFGKLERNQQRYFDWHVKRALGKASCSSVLEVGFGNGSFLAYCKSRGWNATGVELEPQLRERAKLAGFSAFSDIDELTSALQFDLIVLFDVLEHVPSDRLIKFVQTLSTHLTPTGVLLVRVPNGDSPFGRIYQHGDLTHVTTFGYLKLDQVAKICGLKLVAKGESPWYAQQQEGPTLRAFLRATMRYCLNRLFSFAYFGWKVDMSSNLVAVLRHQ